MAKDQTDMSEKAVDGLLMQALSSKKALIDTVWNLSRNYLAKGAGKHTGIMVAKTLKSEWVHKSAPALWAQADTIGNLTDKATHVSVLVGNNVKQFVGVGKDTLKNLRTLRNEVEPYLSAGAGRVSVAPLQRSKNKVIHNERIRRVIEGKYNLYKATTGLTVLLPDLLDMAPKEDGAAKPAAEAVEAATAPESTAVRQVTRLTQLEDRLNAMEGRIGEEAGKITKMLPKDAPAKAGFFVKILTPRLQQLVDKNRNEEIGGPSAYNLIMDLSRQVDKINGPVTKVMHHGTKKQMSLQEYVVEIFKQHQIDCKETEINDRRLGPDFETACKLIAEAIDRRQIDPKGLILLVGENSIIDPDLIVASEEQVTTLLREVQRIEERAEKVNVKSYIGSSAYGSEKEFREILESLDEQEKPFFAALFPDAVLRDAGGLKQKDIDALKDTAFVDFSAQMGRVIKELAETSQDELQRGGLSKKESALIHKWAKALDLDNPEAFAAIDGDTADVLTTAVGNARNYWQERIGGKPVREGSKATRQGAELTDMTVPEEWTAKVAPSAAAGKGADKEPALNR